MSSPLHFVGRRPVEDDSVIDGEYGIERRRETFVTPEKISTTVKNLGGRYALKTTVDAQDGWSYTRDQVDALVEQYCKTSEMSLYASLDDSLQVRSEQLSGAKLSIPAGPYFATGFTGGSTEGTSPTGGIKVTELTIPDPGYEYRVLAFGSIEQRATTNDFEAILTNKGTFGKAGMVAVYAGIRQVASGHGSSNTQYTAITVTPDYGDVSTPMTGDTVVTMYAYATNFGLMRPNFTGFDAFLCVYLLPD